MFLSFVVPVYNTRADLDSCINSILGQSGAEFELILVDDASSDGSGAICDKYAAIDARVRVIHAKENKGVVHSRKCGVNAALGEFVCFVDSDDWISEALLSDVIAEYDGMYPDMILFDSYKEYSNGHRKELRNSVPAGMYDRSRIESNVLSKMFVSADLLGNRNVMPNLWGKMIRQSILAAAYVGYDEKISVGDDLGINVYSFLHASSVGIMHGSCYYHYRINSSSMMNRYNPGLLESTMGLCDWMESAILSAGYPELNTGIDRERVFFAISAYYNEFFFQSQRRYAERKMIVSDIVENVSIADSLACISIKQIAIPNRFFASLIKKKKGSILMFYGYLIKILRPVLGLFIE